MNQEELQTLLKARARVELPADYSQKLLQALHEKQRSVLLQKSLWRIAGERFKTYWGEHSLSTPAFALGWAAIFAAGLAAILLFRPPGGAPPVARQPTVTSPTPIQPPVEALPVTFESAPK